MDNILYSNDRKRLIFCWSKEKEIQIPKGVKEIGNLAFSGCSALESVIIPKGVTEIGETVHSSFAPLCDPSLSPRA